MSHVGRAVGERYAQAIARDPRFTFDERLIPHPERHKKKPTPGETVKPKPDKNDFDYIVTDWAKLEGLRVLANDAETLQIISDQFDVATEDIVGIYDAETQFGHALCRSKYHVASALLTLAVFRPDFKDKKHERKEPWGETELIAFFQISARVARLHKDRDPLAVKGSWTGAFGEMQAEPTSYEAFAMHFNGARCVSTSDDGTPPDPFRKEDAWCSAANQLAKNGYGRSDKQRAHALFLYNRSDSYVGAIMDVADFWAGRHHDPHYIVKHQESLSAPLPAQSSEAACK